MSSEVDAAVNTIREAVRASGARMITIFADGRGEVEFGRFTETSRFHLDTQRPASAAIAQAAAELARRGGGS